MGSGLRTVAGREEQMSEPETCIELHGYMWRVRPLYPVAFGLEDRAVTIRPIDCRHPGRDRIFWLRKLRELDPGAYKFVIETRATSPH